MVMVRSRDCDEKSEVEVILYQDETWRSAAEAIGSQREWGACALYQFDERCVFMASY